MSNLKDKLASIKVLYRAPYSLALYGIPYNLREGQSPRHIDEAYRGDWIYLGSPGALNLDLTVADRETLKAYLSGLADAVPQNPYEFSSLDDEWWSENELRAMRP